MNSQLIGLLSRDDFTFIDALNLLVDLRDKQREAEHAGLWGEAAGYWRMANRVAHSGRWSGDEAQELWRLVR